MTQEVAQYFSMAQASAHARKYVIILVYLYALYMPCVIILVYLYTSYIYMPCALVSFAGDAIGFDNHMNVKETIKIKSHSENDTGRNVTLFVTSYPEIGRFWIFLKGHSFRLV